MVIENEELLQINLNNNLQVGAWYSCNPSSSLTPWVAAIAGRFSKYKYHSLVANYVSGVPTSTPGNVALGAFYDYTDARAWSLAGYNLGALMQCGQSSMGPIYGQSLGTGEGPGSMSLNLNTTTKVYTDFKLCATQTTFDGDLGTIAYANQCTSAWLGIASQPLNGDPGDPAGYLVIRYKIEFIQPVAVSNPSPPSLARSLACPAPKWWQGTQAGWDEFTAMNPGYCQQRAEEIVEGQDEKTD